MVDEAYGTMLSGSGTAPHPPGRGPGSIASAGSGSSGSVVTIIAAPDNNGTNYILSPKVSFFLLY